MYVRLLLYIIDKETDIQYDGKVTVQVPMEYKVSKIGGSGGSYCMGPACGALPGGQKVQPLALSARGLGFFCCAFRMDSSHSRFGSLYDALALD